MNPFTPYWKSLLPPEKRKLADDLGTSYVYLSQISGGHRRAGGDLIRRATKSRPDVLGILIETGA